jgi:cytochrome c biogenesis protein CcmG/thiol:disulfide interchange protein DsbE
MRKTAILIAAALTAAACGGHEEPKQQTATTATTGSAQARGNFGYDTTKGQQPPAAPQTPATATDAAVGQKMPNYQADLLDGGAMFNVSEERGNVVFLNVWATWCGPCRFEIPALQQMHDAHARDGFKVVGVSVDESGVDAVREFAKAQKMTYPIALDAEGRLVNLLGTTVLPTSVLIDRSGTIVWKHFGLVDTNDPELRAAVTKALAEKKS